MPGPTARSASKPVPVQTEEATRGAFTPSEIRRRPILHEMIEPISGKTVLITGATSGIGLEASAKLAGMGAELVLVGRGRARGEAAVAEVKRRSGSRDVAPITKEIEESATGLDRDGVPVDKAQTVSSALRLDGG